MEGPLHSYRRGEGEPAAIEPELVEGVLEEICELRRTLEAGAHGTPERRIETTFLQLVLQRVWEAECARGSEVMRLSTLQQLGGAETIVKGHLDSVMNMLNGRERDAWAKGFRMLVTSTGRKIALSLEDIAGGEEVQQRQLESGLKPLEQGRILRAVPTAGDAGYEIFHDALARPILDWRRRWVDIREKRRSNRRAVLYAVLALLGLGLLAFVVWAFGRNHDAGRSEKEARVLTLAAAADHQLETRPDLAAQFAYQAYRESQEIEHRDLALRALARAETPNTLRVLASSPVPDQVAFSGADELAVTTGNGGFERWDLDDGRPLASLPGAKGSRFRAMALSPDGEEALAVGRDNQVRLWDLHGGSDPSWTIDLPFTPMSAAFSPDGTTVAIGGAGSVGLYDRSSGSARTMRHSSNDRSARLAFSTDGRRLASVDHSGVLLFGVARGRFSSSLHRFVRPNDPISEYSQGGPVAAVAVAGSTVVIAEDGAFVRLNTRSRRWTTMSTTVPVRSLAFSPDGKRLAAGSNHTIRIFRTDTWRRAIDNLVGHTNWVNGVAFSPDGRTLASTGVDGSVRLWSVTLPSSSGSRVHSSGALAFSADRGIDRLGHH